MTEQEIRNKHADSFADLRAQISNVEQVLIRHEFLSGNRQHVAVHALALRLIEFAKGCELVGGAGLAAAHASLGRQCLELGFKLKAVSHGKVTPDDYFGQELISKLKELREVLRSEELRTWFTVEQIDDFERQGRDLKSEIDEHDFKRMTIKEWAGHADESHLYVTVYAILSDFVHSGAGSLNHMMHITGEGRVVMQTGPSDHLVKDVLFGVNSCLFSCAEAIQNMFAESNEH